MDWAKTLHLLKFEEGFRPTPYRCTAGRLTIGYGHNLEAHGHSADDIQGMCWTEDHAASVLLQDAQNAHSSLLREWPWVTTLDDVRQAVLLSMAFQMGVDGLAKFKRTLKAVQQGQYAVAADNMMQSLWARQTPARASRAAQMMHSGLWVKEVGGAQV